MISLGCPSRQEIEASAWLNNGLPKELCDREPILKKYGFYRRLNDSVCTEKKLKIPCYELMAYCNPDSKHWIAFWDGDLERLLGATLPTTTKK